MRFVCENCQTRYVIPDERISGRTLKVRCKKCGNAILLRAGSAGQTVPAGEPHPSPGLAPREEAGEATQMVDAATLAKMREQRRTSAQPTLEMEPAAEEPAEWHVILKDAQLGPLPLSALIQKMVSGDMGPRTYVWKDSMEDWKRAAEVPEVARWIPPTRPHEPGTSPASRVPISPPSANPPPPEAQTGHRADEAAVEHFFRSTSGLHEQPTREHTPTPDPLAKVSSAPDLSSAQPGELTKFFITQAHVTRGRSLWAVAAFGLGVAVLIVGLVLALAQLGVPVPLVNEGPGNQPKIFSGSQGDSKMRDLLLGRPKRGGSPGAGQGSARQGSSRSDQTADPSAQGPLAKRAEQHVDQLGKNDKDQLSRLYATQDLSKLKLKSTEAGPPVLDRPDAPLTAEQVSRTVAKFQTGYTRCIDGELKRNPGFQGGKIRILTTIMSSGLVRQAQIVSDDQRLQRSVASGPLGTCLSEQTRRMVFPSFQGDPFDAEIPLVLSSAM